MAAGFDKRARPFVRIPRSMDFLESVRPADAARALVLAGGAAVLFSSLLGLAMLVPRQPWGTALAPYMPPKAFGPAHLDWIMLGLMLGLAAGVVTLTDTAVPRVWVAMMVAGAWLNPLPYLFRAFGVDAFVLAGALPQRAAASLGLSSSLLLVSGWSWLLLIAWVLR